MNRLPGRVLGVESSDGIALVEVACGSLCLAALLLAADELPPAGTDVTLAFKETEVALAKDLSGRISLRNRLPGRVLRVESGALLARVTLEIEGHTVEAIITARSASLLELAPGDQVLGLVKANEMTICERAWSDR